jgi:hypothetical protein
MSRSDKVLNQELSPSQVLNVWTVNDVSGKRISRNALASGLANRGLAPSG